MLDDNYRKSMDAIRGEIDRIEVGNVYKAI